MKKTFIVFAAFGLFAATLISCEQATKSETTTDSTVVASGDTSKTTVTKTETVKTSAPVFSSDEVNKGIADFSKLKDEYVVALKNKNADEVKALTEKYNTWTQKATTWVTKLKPNEIKKYTDYMAKVANEWVTAGKEAVK